MLIKGWWLTKFWLERDSNPDIFFYKDQLQFQRSNPLRYSTTDLLLHHILSKININTFYSINPNISSILIHNLIRNFNKKCRHLLCEACKFILEDCKLNYSTNSLNVTPFEFDQFSFSIISTNTSPCIINSDWYM